MPDEYEVTNVAETEISSLAPGVPGTPAYVVSMRKPDGEMHHHTMPKHTIAAKAIEYGMDSEADFDDVVDMILHEPFAPNAGEPGDPAVLAGYFTKIGGQVVAASLHTAETIKDAREAEQLRTQHAKEHNVRINFPPEHSNKLWAAHRAERKAVREGTREEHPELRNLRNTVQAQRREIRGRSDGKPLRG
jgi:hypothetical protein